MHRRPSTNVTKFTAIAVNGFYTMTRSGLMTTADSDSPENIQCDELRTLAADEKAMKELYAQAEVLQTATQPKRLVVYKEYLLWFRDLPTNDEPRVPDSASTPHKGTLGAEALTSCSTSKASSPKRNTPVLEGYANIRGMYVESNHSTKIHQWAVTQSSDWVASNQQNTKEIPFYPSEMPANNSFLQMRIFRVPHTPNQESIYFRNVAQIRNWRTMISKVPVLFTDYENCFEEMRELAGDSRFRSSIVRHNSTGETYLAKEWKLHHIEDGDEQKKILAECMTDAISLCKLDSLGITPRFLEAHALKQSLVLVSEYVESDKLGEWCDQHWLAEKLDKLVDKRLSLTIMKDLAFQVLKMHNSGVCHLNISRDTFLVRITPTFTNAPGHSHRANSLISDLKSSVSGITCLKNGEAKIDFVLSNFSRSVVLSRQIDWNWIKEIQRYSELFATSAMRDPWYHSANDVHNLGIVFYEIVYGLDIPTLMQRTDTFDRDFLQNLMAKPDRYIALREQTHFVGDQVEELIAAMLNPNWERRPTMTEVVQILQSLLDERNLATEINLLDSQRQNRLGQHILDRPSFQDGTATLLLDQTGQFDNPLESASKLFVSVGAQGFMPQPKNNSKFAPSVVSRKPLENQPQRLSIQLEVPLRGFNLPDSSDGKPKPSTHKNWQHTGLKLQRSLDDHKDTFSSMQTSSRGPAPSATKFSQINFNQRYQKMNQKLFPSDDMLRSSMKLGMTSGTLGSIREDFDRSQKSKFMSSAKGAGSLPGSRRSSPVPLVFLAGRLQFSEQNKLKRVVLPAGESVVRSGVSLSERPQDQSVSHSSYHPNRSRLSIDFPDPQKSRLNTNKGFSAMQPEAKRDFVSKLLDNSGASREERRPSVILQVPDAFQKPRSTKKILEPRGQEDERCSTIPTKPMLARNLKLFFPKPKPVRPALE